MNTELSVFDVCYRAKNHEEHVQLRAEDSYHARNVFFDRFPGLRILDVKYIGSAPKFIRVPCYN